jgi:hypothetical protein
VVDDLAERLAGVAGAVLANPVEDHDRVVTLKPMTVSIAVTNRPSILTPEDVPSRAKMPTTTITSWSSATSGGGAELDVPEAERDPA